jgi:transcription-repair coupling factor (superfamily II helicase)
LSGVFDKLLNAIKKTQSYKNLKDSLNNKNETRIKQLAGSLRPLIASALFADLKVPVMFITPDSSRIPDLEHDLKLISGENSVINLAKDEKKIRPGGDASDEHEGKLIEGLSRFLNSPDSILIGNAEILQSEIPAPDNIISSNIIISKNRTVDYREFTQNMMLQGFERKDYVAEHGDIAIRGGIVDIFPLGWNNPLRIEFWGDEIESIREFNALSQRSVTEHKEVTFVGSLFSGTGGGKTSIKDYLPGETIVFIDYPDEFDKDEFNPDIFKDYKVIYLNGLGKGDINFQAVAQPDFSGHVKDFSAHLQEIAVSASGIFLSAEGDIHLKRFREMLDDSMTLDVNESETSPSLLDPDSTLKKIIWIGNSLSSGFKIENSGPVYYTEHQLFKRTRIRDRKTSTKNARLTLKELKELKIGDYVVHEDKGVGRFDGFQTVAMGGSNQDCMRIIFAGDDLLYVHLNYLNRVSKYSASEGTIPVLSKLGSGEWTRKKAKTKKKLKDIARNLIKLYAKRKMKKGFPFPADDVWQREFEASFMYEDTPDQARTTDEVKRDMESETPMDRLVCGDVGFGKTEIAIRAAFKAIQSGKQAAVLVPTTILAQQHYMSFIDRFNNYPVNVEVISRFRSKKQQNEITDKLKSGGVDILIGTHRLLSKDIEFKNLGLLVIDEEHRFGVSAKEKLRELRAEIDTLTLTATPIPRTLNFSLLGARDLSVIETPPRNRIPVQTEVVEWDSEILIESFERELKRGGQVFFVSDRINDLEKISIDLQMLVPSAKIAVAHGQMPSAKLEKIMERFIEGEYDVLISTKIIESGIDIPNANTMIINRANNFGLAELYQLRGRVGRSNVQAYCYLLLPQNQKLNPTALRRLQAIEEFTELGSGFRLAMRDMEIRGAGNLLGAEQSGFIIDMGFELFHKILDEAVQELKNEEFSDLFDEEQEDRRFVNEDVAIELDKDALFPTDYISKDSERFQYYKKLYSLKNNSELDETISEITDKYGKLPKEARELLFAVKVRIAAIATGFSRIIIKEGKMLCEFPPNEFEEFYSEAFPMIIDYIKEVDGAKLNQGKKKLMLEMQLDNRERAVELLWKIKKTLEHV